MARWPRLLGCVLLALWLPSAAPQESSDTAPSAGPAPVESYQFAVEWRLIRAGKATLSRYAKPGSGWQAELQLESTGIISKLYRVKDVYRAWFDSGFCVSSTFLRAEEGSRRRETTVRYLKEARKSHYLEHDLVKKNVVLEKELEVPECVHDILAALARLRGMDLSVGQAVQLPVSDGKRLVSARVEAQERERVKTSSGSYNAIRYEAFLFNDVLYKRKGRLFIWLTDDERKLPVQVKAKLSFPVGTISFQLEKEGVS